uniref:Uncharacterized protein n=1 Tax=Oryza punctata TaxID=4537 RepID=A0A0E0M7V4_ORYPU
MFHIPGIKHSESLMVVASIMRSSRKRQEIKHERWRRVPAIAATTTATRTGICGCGCGSVGDDADAAASSDFANAAGCDVAGFG